MKTFWLALSIAGALPMAAAYTLVSVVAALAAFEALRKRLGRRRAVAAAQRIIHTHITQEESS